jgi:soluble lytic murein transglycosylase-like protein
MRQIKAAFLLMLALYVSGTLPAWGAKRKIEFPPSDADRIIKVDILPKKPAQSPVQPGRQRLAKIQAIANLFINSNPKLGQKRAADYANYVVQAGEEFGQDPFVIAAMIVHESTVHSDAVSRGGDYGLMQVRWSVHKKKIMSKYPNIKTSKDILDPRYNILVGTEIFASYRGNSDIRSGLLRYSAGNRKLTDRIFATKQKVEKTYNKLLKAK